MSDLIDRQAAIDAVNEYLRLSEVSKTVQNMTSIQAILKWLPSAQHTGRWIVVSDGYGNGEATACICECSECKDTIWVYKKSDRKWNYCPNCGARMGGEQE